MEEYIYKQECSLNTNLLKKRAITESIVADYGIFLNWMKKQGFVDAFVNLF